ncbi:hypothetical protein [Lactobacillus sp. LL6]|uniref:aggregation-promoting factor n=1 Tax=Lactobacillus sp. LL6 TaxID=2596827 RepID=UPI001F5B26E6|nr:hypothetical protein [Lactobacillus sp. LL6]
MKNSKAILVKTLATAAFTAAGIVTVNKKVEDSTVQAAVVQNDATIYTVKSSTAVYSDYNTPKKTGQILSANTDWKVIKTAYDSKGNKWYDLGKNQWVKVENTANNVKAKTKKTTVTSTNNISKPQTQTTTQTTSTLTRTQSQVSTQSSSTSTSTYTSSATGSEASAKAWIAGRESGGSYSARNGQYVGKYQLSASYLGGDYSAANQEKAADNYVKSHYGSWSAAKSFWQSNGWY